MRITLTAVFILFAISFSFAQVPGVKWTKYQGLNPYSDEAFFDAKGMPDGGFILAGNDTTGGYSKEAYLKKDPRSRPFLSRTDKDGSVLWNLYSTDVDYFNGAFTSVDINSSGDIIAAGYGMTSYLQPVKYLIAKYDSNGNKAWSKIYGGTTGVSKAYSIQPTSDNGYIVAGVTTSNDGDVIGNHNAGTDDVWLLKLDNSGNIQWKKCFGGSGNDSAYSVIQTPDNGFVIIGSSTSSDGDLVGNSGASDAWIFKVDNSGNLVWQKNIGGSADEDFRAIVYNSDTSYTVTGFTSSSTITNNGNYGMRDLWLIKLKDATGDIQWSKNFGGSNDEQGLSIHRTIGNGYLVTGYTESTNGDVSGNNGLADAWLLKLDVGGNLLWQKCVGTNKNDFGMAGIYLSENDFAVAGFAEPVAPIYPQYDQTDNFLSRLGNANTIKGLLFLDANNNGIKDAGEVGFSDAIVNTTKSGYQKSTIPQNGLFHIDVDLGTYTTSLQVSSPYYNIAPTSINSTFSSYFNSDSITFAVQPIPLKRDLVINIIPLTPARAGTFSKYKIVYKNVGTEIITNGEIVLGHDHRLFFDYSIPNVIASNGYDTLKWSYSNLKPLDSASIFLSMYIPTSVILRDSLRLTAFISPATGDITPLDDTAKIKQIITGPYDPNDKIENNGGIIGSDYITQGKYLNYTIRFQNTGTDTAFNVIVRDTLDSKLDWATFEMVTTSHPYTVSITNQNKIEWTFANINLPDSNINEPASHGYVAYRVKPKSTATVGDVINNLASIYFDYNLPVATNNAITLIQDNFSALPIQLINFTGQLNNNTVQLKWRVSDAKNFERFEIERSTDGRIYNRIENVTFNSSITDYTSQDNISTLQANHIFYRLKLIDTDGKFTYSKVVAFNVNVQNHFLVYPNPAKTEMFVSITSDKNENLQLKIIDASGRIISDQQKEIQKGNNVFPVNTSKLKAGNYMFQIISQREVKTSKFVIMN